MGGDNIPPTTITLSLNRPALERLIGNDTQLEVELRHQVVEEFAKRHLKEVVQSEIFERVLKAALQEVDAAALTAVKQAQKLVEERIGQVEGTSWAPTIKLNDKFRTAINSAAVNAVRDAIPNDEIVAHVDRHVDALKRWGEQQIRQAVERVYGESFKAAVQAEVQKLLSSASMMASVNADGTSRQTKAQRIVNVPAGEQPEQD